MLKNKIIQTIENFTQPELAEKWDCSGWIVETERQNIEKIMLCLTVTEDAVNQAKVQNCDMIISHHPLFKIDCHSKLVSEFFHPLIDVYCAHTNLDKTDGGTTDKLVEALGFKKSEKIGDFLRILDCEISMTDFTEKLSKISKHLRIANNQKITQLKRIAFCAGSGSEFIQEAFENGADALVTGDIKFHTALESPIVLFDVGHFESEIMVLDVFEDLLKSFVKIVRAKEESPFE